MPADVLLDLLDLSVVLAEPLVVLIESTIPDHLITLQVPNIGSRDPCLIPRDPGSSPRLNGLVSGLVSDYLRTLSLDVHSSHIRRLPI